MIKWLWNKIVGKKEPKILFCDFCNEQVADGELMMEFEMLHLASSGVFHAACFEGNEEECEGLLKMIADAAEDRKREVLEQLMGPEEIKKAKERTQKLIEKLKELADES